MRFCPIFTTILRLFCFGLLELEDEDKEEKDDDEEDDDKEDDDEEDEEEEDEEADAAAAAPRSPPSDATTLGQAGLSLSNAGGSGNEE